MKHGIRFPATVAGTVLGALAAQPALAQFPSWTPVSEAVLAGSRGGFLTPQGLQINFSLENVVMVNGALQVHTILRMGDRIASAVTDAADAVPPAVGAGSTGTTASGTPAVPPSPVAPTPLAAPAPPPLPGSAGTAVGSIVSGGGGGTTVLASGLQTIIQNSLDAQQIQSIKIMNIEITNMRDLRTSGLHSRVQTSLIEAMR